MKSFNPRNWNLTHWTAFAMLMGLAVGFLWPSPPTEFKAFSKGVVTLIQMVATPLLFFAIVDGIIKTGFRGRGLCYMLFISMVNGLCAITIALTISNLFHPGQYLMGMVPGSAHLVTASHWLAEFQSSLSHSNKNLMTGTTLAIVLALGVGSTLLVCRLFFGRTWEPTQTYIEKLLHFALTILFRIIEWIIVLVPAAVFCSVVYVVGSHGLSAIPGVLAYFLSCFGGMFLQIFLVYQTWIFFIARFSPKRFWKEAARPAIHGFGINSSLATLPTTLSTLKNLGVSDHAARLSCCIGTNFNNDGILLYEVVATLFLLQAYGYSLTLFEQFGVAIICVIATIGVAGIPEAGLISLTLVISAIGLPIEVLPILMTVDWILARCRSLTNVLGDMTVAIGIDALERKSPKR